MRVVLWTVALFTALSAHAADVQSAAVAQRPAASGSEAARTETPDEVIVRGKRLAEFRVEVQTARERAYAIFNEINGNDDFDVLCRDETRYFSHAKRRVCRARFEGRISSQAAKEYMNTVAANCPAGRDGAIQWQACTFSSVGQSARANAQAVEAQAPGMHDRMNDEILRLARTDLRFGQAILDFFEASQRYDAARERREE